MTSLQLFPAVEHNPTVPKEWGSGKFKEDVNVYIPGPPTWQYRGEPTEQFYTLTQLKLSNVRTNDELVPRPQVDTMGDKLINRDFPAEHPYSSHIPRYAIFPTFESPEDPKKGVRARREMPINAEMPATAYDVAVIQKTKGHGLRRELQVIPKESEKRGLEWSGEDGFHQLVKCHGGRQQFYPTPQKTVVPNLNADRWESMKLSDRAANTLRNIERDHWQTHYNRQHTGIGPANPNKLDNLDDKVAFYEATGLEDDNLYPSSINTFDPARPFEGRISRKLIPKPPPQKPATDDGTNRNYIRRMTEHEREEDRLWNGKDYINLPDTEDETTKYKKSLRWKEINDESHPDPNLEKIETTILNGVPEPIPYPSTVGPTGKREEDYLKTTKEKQDHRFMEIEAQNRFNELELQKPSHDLTSLHYKMERSRETEKPKTFYDHEGKYNEERAGLYRTNYLPERLAFSMNEQERSAPELMNTFHSHEDAINLPTRLNHDMKEAFKNSRTLCSSLPNLAGDMRESWQVLQPLQHVKEADKSQLQPTQETARVRTQEKELIQKDSDTGSRFNTSKFLQENSLVPFARNEPLNVMSNENQNLDNVKLASAGSKSMKSVSFSPENTIAQSNGYGTSVRIISSPQRMRKYQVHGSTVEPEQGETNTAQYKSTHALCNVTAEEDPSQKPSWLLQDNNLSMPPRAASFTLPQESKSKPGLSRKPRRRAYSSLDDSEYKDEFSSYSSNVAPTNMRHSISFATSYGNQFPNYSNLSYKFDERLLWEPGYGFPRPQTKLLDIQDSFNKSDLRKKFHTTFSETNPDLRDNIIKGKKHTFYGISAQNLHG